MINDLLQNIYNRIAQMGKAISKLQQSIDQVNENLNTKIQKVVDTISQMSDDVGKEGSDFQNLIKQAGDQFVTEIKKLQSNIGLTDLEQLTSKLKQIAQTSEETLKPETVDVLLQEVLSGIKTLTSESPKPKETKSEEQESKTDLTPLPGKN
jgi:phage-related protein